MNKVFSYKDIVLWITLILAISILVLCYSFGKYYYEDIEHKKEFYHCCTKHIKLDKIINSNKDSLLISNSNLCDRIDTIQSLLNHHIAQESHIQDEIDIMIDKNSHWVGMWIGILSVIVTLYTILQMYTNYRSISDAKIEITDLIEQNNLNKGITLINNAAYEISNSNEICSFIPEDRRDDFLRNQILTLCESFSICIKELKRNETITSEQELIIKQMMCNTIIALVNVKLFITNIHNHFHYSSMKKIFLRILEKDNFKDIKLLCDEMDAFRKEILCLYKEI